MSVIINILAAIGLIVIISYMVYYLYTYFKKKQFQASIAHMNPPPSYMQNIGINCPDYWVNMGTDSNGNVMCKNSFNIPVNDQTKCKSNMTFTKVPSDRTWEFGNPNGLKSLSNSDKYKFVNNSVTPDGVTRCNWINQCGPSSSIQGIWQGVNEICNSPPPSDS
jgi:hypothetical protein